MQRMVRRGLAWGALVTLGSVSCAIPTSFEGEAKFPGGLDGCRRQCAARQLDFGSFIYIGEYSTACACKAPAGAPAPLPPGAAPPVSGAAPTDEEAAVAAAVAGAELQRRAIQRQQAAHSSAVGAGIGGGLR